MKAIKIQERLNSYFHNFETKCIKIIFLDTDRTKITKDALPLLHRDKQTPTHKTIRRRKRRRKNI